MKKDILIIGDSVLREKSAVVEKVDDEVRKIAQDLIDSLDDALDGMGLAAPQIGYSVRMILADNKIMINPIIFSTSEETVKTLEGCLSIPRVYTDVVRYATVTIQYSDLDGESHTLTLSGIKGIVVQHEIDHLDGILFIDRIPHKQRTKLRTKIKQATRLGKRLKYKNKKKEVS